ncbi:lachesin-like isoform X1 [Mytilus edulis]|uniref:lachesin-like isoform X1 n=1 Tax=Mytilus edulis TaxID=6550 RepID=UPI0039EE2FFD
MMKHSVLNILVTFLFCSPTVEPQEPSFDVPLFNITAKAGETAILPCSVQQLGSHWVAWLDPREKVLTARDQRIISDARISVERPFKDDWNLYIRDVEHSDAGKYMCQINTDPVKIKYVMLYVHEPPRIIEESSTSKKTAKEGDTVQLFCNATGIPEPTVTWYRRRSDINRQAKEVVGQNGEVLIIYNISRYCEDLYECVAVNGIQPAASKEIKVVVEFSPEIFLVPKRISQTIGKETILDCRITANPHIYSAWVRHEQEIENNYKYQIELYTEDNKNTITLSLRIKMIGHDDFGKYICRASNKLGKDEELVILSELVVRTEAPSTTADTFIQPTTRHNYIDPHDSSWKGGHEDQYFPPWSHGYQNSPETYGRNNDRTQETGTPNGSIIPTKNAIHVFFLSTVIWLCYSY